MAFVRAARACSTPGPPDNQGAFWLIYRSRFKPGYAEHKLNSPDIGSDIWLVIHIPKTAGTSFRWALEKRFGKHQVVRDYGPEANATSPLVLDHLYNSDRTVDGRSALIETMKNGSGKIIIGHFPLEKYAMFFEPERIIAFVRDPLVRTCSEYLHRVRHGMFEGSLSEFFQIPAFQNQQARLLRGLSKQSFIGLTERYNDALKRINAANSWNLPKLKKNIGRKGGGRKLAESLATPELDYFYKVNQQDMDLYEASRLRFESTETPGKRTGFLDLLSWK